MTIEFTEELTLVTPQEASEDVEKGFTPKSFDEYLGQTIIKQKLQVYTKASLQREEALDHLLLFGPPGLGKTTLAQVMAHELQVPIKVTSAPVLERTGDLVALLTNLGPREILFIDEIHRLPKTVEEVLYSAMEQGCVDMMVGSGAGAKSIRLPLNPFTLIGATTKTAMISGPLQTRFGIVERLDFYSAEELADIVMQNATHLEMNISTDAALSIGKRGRGTPRIVKRIVRRVRDYAQVHDHDHIDEEAVNAALRFLGIDASGLNKLDRDVLSCILTHFNGGPVGLETLAAMTGEDKDTLEDVCEPFLMRQGLLQKTPRGRVIPAQKIPYLQKLLGTQDAIQETLIP